MYFVMPLRSLRNVHEECLRWKRYDDAGFCAPFFFYAQRRVGVTDGGTASSSFFVDRR